MNLIQINQFSHLHNGENIFFCKTDFLRGVLNFISSLNQNVILITGNSDYSITDDIAELAPSNVKYWYAQNAECKSRKGKKAQKQGNDKAGQRNFRLNES